MLWIAIAQPATAVMPCAIGTKTNWPNEPPALTMPLAMPRLAGGASRAVAAISTDGPAKPAPPAASTPIAKIRPKVVVISGTSAVPSATSSRPKRSDAARAVAVGDDAGERLRQPPPQLADAEREADAGEAEAGAWC